MLPASNPTPAVEKDRSRDGLDAPLLTRATLIPFILITVLFFLWAIPNNLNDVLIRQFMKSFTMSRLGAGLVQFAFYLGYFFLAMPAGLIMRKFGYKSGFLIGLSFFTLGAFLFWPAALADSYGFFLAALFIIASGCSFLETASNPFIAQLGDPRSAARRLNLAQSFNPVGSITGVLIGTVFIFSGVSLDPAQVAGGEHLLKALLFRCRNCGDCALAELAFLCPQAGCAKFLLNGPCGGSNEGLCEAADGRSCAWELIFQRLKEQDRLELLDRDPLLKDMRKKDHPMKQINPLYQDRTPEAAAAAEQS